MTTAPLLAGPDAAAGASPLRVLFLSPRLPWPLHSGTHQRLFHLARGLAARHHVRVLAFDGEQPDRPATDVEAFLYESGCAELERLSVADCAFRRTQEYEEWAPPARSLRALVDSPLPSAVRRERSPSLVAKLAELRAQGVVDVVVAGKAYMAEQAREAGLAPVVVDVDDLDGPLAVQRVAGRAPYRRQWLHRLEARKAAWYERRLPRRFEQLLVCKDEDRAWFAEADQGRVTVVPNGVAIPTPVDPRREEPATLLFVGSLGYGPNVDAVRWFHREVLPLVRREWPAARFEVAGRAYAADDAEARGVYDALAADPACHLVVSPRDLRDLYERATVVVAPVRYGGGTRVKVLEAPAYGKPLVATRFAPVGLDLRDGVDVLLAEDADGFARHCAALLADAARRRAIGDAARARVSERYAWSRIEPTMARIAEQVAARAR